MPDKIKTLIIDNGFDPEVKEFKKAGVRVLRESGFWLPKTHGTAVTGVYVRTLKRLLEAYYNKKINLKDYVDIDFHDADEIVVGEEDDVAEGHNNQVHAELLKALDKGLDDEDAKLFYETIGDQAVKFKFIKEYSNVKYDSINMSIGISPANYAIYSFFHNEFKQLVQNGTFIAIAAGNSKFLTTNDRTPENDPYACIVGAYYSKKQVIPDGVATRVIGDKSTPGSVWFSVPGARITYNTVSALDYYAQDKEVKLDLDLENKRQLAEWVSSDEFSQKELEKYNKSIREIAMKDPSMRGILSEEKVYISGTSFATPYVTALKDFVKIVRPKLDARNIERLLLEAVEPIDISTLKDGWEDEKISHIMRSERRNHAETRNGVIGKSYSYELGFGRLDKQRLVHLTQTWVEEKIEEVEFSLERPTAAYQEKGHYVYVYNCPQDYKVFNVTLAYTSSVPRKELSSLSITSPAGTKDFIYYTDHSPKSFQQKMKEKIAAKSLSTDDTDLFFQFTNNQLPINNRATNIHFNGEGTKDEWIVRSNVPLERKKLTFRAEKWRIDNVYRYDDEILAIEKPRKLEDKNDGYDIIDLSYYKAGKISVNLQKDGDKPRGITFMAPGDKQKFVPIGEGTFEKVLLPERLGE